MAYEYKFLTDEQRTEMAWAQVEQFERDLFVQEMNLMRLEAIPEDTSQNEAAIRATITTIVRAIERTAALAARLDDRPDA